MRVILNLFQTILTVVAAAVVVSYIIRRYETRNRDSQGTAAYGNTSAAQRALGVGGEIAASFLAVLSYPLGYIMGEYPWASLRRGERPIILCHGYRHNRSAFILLRYRLKSAGRSNIIAPNFKPASESIPCFAAQLSEKVDRAKSQTGCDKVDLIGHSMGGLVIRYFIEKLGGSTVVGKAITLGSPHRGTKMAALGLFDSAQQFHPDSTIIRELSEMHSSSDAVNLVSIWSEFDNIVLPPENALLPGKCNGIMVRNVGHIAMLFSGKVFSELRRALEEQPRT